MWLKEIAPKRLQPGAEHLSSGGAQGPLREVEGQDWQKGMSVRGL